jgi:hypothetical protein
LDLIILMMSWVFILLCGVPNHWGAWGGDVTQKGILKGILKIGTSMPQSSSRALLYSVHAEDMALDAIRKELRHHGRAKYTIADFTILIWKQNAAQQIRPIACCSWCAHQLQRVGMPISNILTVSDDGSSTQLAISDTLTTVPPLLKTLARRR